MNPLFHTLTSTHTCQVIHSKRDQPRSEIIPHFPLYLRSVDSEVAMRSPSRVASGQFTLKPAILIQSSPPGVQISAPSLRSTQVSSWPLSSHNCLILLRQSAPNLDYYLPSLLVSPIAIWSFSVLLRPPLESYLLLSWLHPALGPPQPCVRNWALGRLRPWIPRSSSDSFGWPGRNPVIPGFHTRQNLGLSPILTQLATWG